MLDIRRLGSDTKKGVSYRLTADCGLMRKLQIKADCGLMQKLQIKADCGLQLGEGTVFRDFPKTGLDL